MTLNRRQMMMGSLGLGAGLAAVAGPRTSLAEAATLSGSIKSVVDYGVITDTDRDQTAVLQESIDTAASRGEILHFPAGLYVFKWLTLPENSNLTGVPGQTILRVTGRRFGLMARRVKNIHLSGLTIEGIDMKPHGEPLIAASDVEDFHVSLCRIRKSVANGMSLSNCSGRITDTEIVKAARTGLFCLDSKGLEITHNHVHDCANNGIQVWTSEPAEDGTIVSNNRIQDIRAIEGGSGQNGNGINIFRAGSVQVTGNRITDCEYSAVRGNAASNMQVLGNSCARLGEVAIYAEFGFEGALIANNLVDKAASGISITNYNEGGRMAVAQGNLIRNLFLRNNKRGVGIAVEADAVVTGNMIEGAPGGGIMIGWGKYLRDVNATGNLVRDARIGIGISIDNEAGYAYVTNNMISGTKEGGIRAMDHEKLLGPDLARTSSESYRNIAVIGNVSL